MLMKEGYDILIVVGSRSHLHMQASVERLSANQIFLVLSSCFSFGRRFVSYGSVFCALDALVRLRGSNNKHLLLKCINCNKNNNKLKQLQKREDWHSDFT